MTGTWLMLLMLPFASAGTSATTEIVPTITAISPRSAIAGGEPFELVVDGTGFVAGATVRWNGSPRPTTFVSSTQLKASIATADLKVGTTSITVANPAAVPGVSAAYSLSVVHAAPVLTSLYPQRVAAGSASFTLRIIGQNFVRNGTYVQWKGTNRGVTFLSPGAIAVTVSASDVETAGTASVAVMTVVQLASGLTTSARVTSPMSFFIDPPATPAAPIATRMQAVSATSQQGTAGRSVAQPPAVVVRDQLNAAMSGVPVSFVVTSGNGSIKPSVVNTDASGVARLSDWILGSSGAQTVAARLPNLPAITFTATLPLSVAIAIQPLAPPDLALSYAQSSNPIVAGTRQTYTLKVFNRGGTNATGISVRTDLPADLNFVGATGDHGFTCAASGTTLNCGAGVLNANDSARITIAMSLPLLASSGHTIQIASRADPANAIAETDELNNLAGAVAQTKAAVAPVISYSVTSDADLRELFTLALAKGFQFLAIPLDKDANGKPGLCYFYGAPSDGHSPPYMRSQWTNPAPLGMLDPELRCHYEFFKNQTLPAGWELRSVTWRIEDKITYVQAPNRTPGSGYFSLYLKGPTSTGLTSVVLRGPVGLTWRDAFK